MKKSPLGGASLTLEQFRALAPDHRVIPVTRRLIADAETPVGLYRKLADGAPGTFLLESSGGGTWARYSFVGVRSLATLTERDGQAHWLGTPPAGIPTSGDPLEAAAATLAALATDRHDDLPPLTSGLVGYFGWDVVRRWEKLGHGPIDELQIPELSLMLAADLAIFDHLEGTVLLIANAVNVDNTADRVDEAYQDACDRLDAMTTALAQPAASTVSVADLHTEPELKNRTTHDDYVAAIEAGKRAIVDGEVFQVVLAQRFDLPCDVEPLEVYRILRGSNPSPYMYLLSLQDSAGRGYAIVGSSPEALVKVTGTEVITHPIAGSRPRGSTPEDDQRLGAELLEDAKERAEHLMLVDLARNDLSKVCRPGTVEVVEFMEIERYSHIMHLVSTVIGRLGPNYSAFDVLRATFPAGTLSGAPKPRALRLIDQLEPVSRGVYGGVVGYLDFTGDLDLAIAIRTALLKDGYAHVQAGGGIVADSVPETEIIESENKAAAVLRAVAIAQTMRTVR
ncbi:anthranilate synthase component I [Saxibacter everestensis]|uniref:Anthranilate synthase component 1 n=1 Tax=Saxibacter everestensis TaxID=2909229 RepID=A0ABY8R030_9MICO|nr:anthranilate synthase component I [Brevibacteriaceae bacterium ZFBP1038]